MINLPIPLKEIEQKEIYEKCADALENKTALGYLEKAVESAALYEQFVPMDIAHFPEFEIIDGDKKEIEKVYDYKFAKENSVGRTYYEAIKINANGRCPICGGGKLKNLDHFLPKSKYPLLCVTPANLIPECRDCNQDKSKSFSKDYYSLTFNPYFDVMKDEWLECEINFRNDKTFDLKFYNGFDKTEDPLLWKKYETHLLVHDLNKTFSAKALEDIEYQKYQYQDQLRECGEESIKNTFVRIRNSCERSDINSWKAALYRELAKKVHDYCVWLNRI